MHNILPKMDHVSLIQLLSRHAQLLTRLYTSAGLRDPNALMFDEIAGADYGNGLYALLGFRRFEHPNHGTTDSNIFVTPACLDLVDISRETVRGRALLSDMRLGLAAATYSPEVIAEHLAAFSHDRAIVFGAVQHTRELRCLLRSPTGGPGLTARYLECLTVTEKSRLDEDGTLLVRSLLALNTCDVTHAMIIPDGARERELVATAGFRKTSGKSSCWFYAAPTNAGPEAGSVGTVTASVIQASDGAMSEHSPHAFA